MVKERFTGRPMMLGARRASPAPLSGSRTRGPSRTPPGSVPPFGPAVVAAGAVEAAGLQVPFGRGLGPLALRNAEAHALLVRPSLALGLTLLLAVAVEVDDVAHHASGPIIFLGSTNLSNSSADT